MEWRDGSVTTTPTPDTGEVVYALVTASIEDDRVSPLLTAC